MFCVGRIKCLIAELMFLFFCVCVGLFFIAANKTAGYCSGLVMERECLFNNYTLPDKNLVIDPGCKSNNYTKQILISQRLKEARQDKVGHYSRGF